MHRNTIIAYTLLLLLAPRLHAQNAEVTAHVHIHDKVASPKHLPSPADVVVWLTPLQPDKHPAATGHPGPDGDAD